MIAGDGGGAAAGGAVAGFFIVMMIFWILMMILAVGGTILWVWMIIDGATRPQWQYPDARPNSSTKIMWILILVLGGVIGAAVYYFVVYKKVGKSNPSLPAPAWWYQPPYPYPYPPPGSVQPYAYPPQGYPPAPQPGGDAAGDAWAGEGTAAGSAGGSWNETSAAGEHDPAETGSGD